MGGWRRVVTDADGCVEETTQVPAPEHVVVLEAVCWEQKQQMLL